MRPRPAEGTATADARAQTGPQCHGRVGRACLGPEPSARPRRARDRGASKPSSCHRVRRAGLGDLIPRLGTASACHPSTRCNRAVLAAAARRHRLGRQTGLGLGAGTAWVYATCRSLSEKEESAMRRVLVLGIATLLLLAGAGVARADHTHVLVLPNGKCAILAAEGNEKYLILPEVLFSNNPNVDADDAAGGLEGLPLNRRHPLHVLVHLGVPGADGDIAVMGSAQDPCAATGNYVNG